MRNLSYFLIAAIIFSLAAVAGADVIVKQVTSSDMMGMMKMDVNGTEYIKGDKSCNIGKMKMKGGMAAMMESAGAGGMETCEITRIDKGVKWNLDAKSNTYTEMTLAEIDEMMGEDESYDDSDNNTGMGKEDEYDWTFEVTSSDEEVDINGFKCKNITGKATGVGIEDPDARMQLTFEYWYAEDVPGKDELNAYYESMANATGTEMKHNQKGAEAFYGEYGSQFGEMFEKLEESGGYPIKTNILIEGNQSMNAMGGQDVDLDDENIPSGMKDMLGGMFGKKKEEKSTGGMKTIFSVTNEVKSIEQRPVDDSQFEIPEDYQKAQY